MKKYSLIILALLVVIMGVSCTDVDVVSECNLKAKVRGLETADVVFQYSVVKNDGSIVYDWTGFDISKGFSVNNLVKGNYTFKVRGITKKGALMYAGSETRFLAKNATENIVIILYDQIDESNQESTLTLNVDTASTGLTCSVTYKNCLTGTVNSCDLSKKGDTGFSLTLSLSPGYYEVSVFVYREGVEVGGTFEAVFIPTGYDKVLNLSISPRMISGIKDINTTSSLTLGKGDDVTLVWKGNGGGESNGYWMVNNKVVEDNAFYYKLPTSDFGSYTVEYHRGKTVKSCSVTIGEPSYTSIMNFRSTSSKNEVCIGYVDKTTGASFPITKQQVAGGKDFDPSDYDALNLKPVYLDEDKDSLVGKTFAEINSIGVLSTLAYGPDLVAPNTTIVKMIIHGDIEVDVINERLTALEEVLVDGADDIKRNAFKNLTNLKTVYIIPTAETTISRDAFTGSGVTDIYVIGTSSQISLATNWNRGTSLTENNITYCSELPL